MRKFGSERVMGLMERLGMEEGVPIEAGMVSRSIERAQKQVEGRNFEIRKHLLEYDDVMNKQRETVYTLRKGILEGREGREYVLNAAEDIAGYLIDLHLPKEEKHGEQWNEAELNAELFDYFGMDLHSIGADPREIGRDIVEEKVLETVKKRYEEREALVGADMMRIHEKYLVLQVLDVQWKDHLLALDHLKEGIGLRGYGQRDPLVEYKKESFDMLQAMLERVQDRVVKVLYKTEIVVEEGAQSGPRSLSRPSPVAQLPLPTAPKARDLVFSAPSKEAAMPQKRKEAKVGRNDPCPCGSGKKYKKCHGIEATA